MDYKRLFKNIENESIFYKTTVNPAIGSADKAVLNRKGNIYFNNGDIENARRIFLTTGYSDGLIRVGDAYRSNGRLIDALRMYWIAPDRNKSEPIIMKLSMIIQTLLIEENNHG
ncbi:MAG: hypothetical protein FWD78_04130 [Treponema sp.]|nr:hypothetical protein [Treponema sp.]